MAETKTKPTTVNVDEFLAAAVDNDEQRADCLAIAKLMKKITKANATMWGPTIVGFGKYHYKYASGHEGDSCIAAFAPRGKEIVLYISAEMPTRAGLLAKLGKHRSGKSCVYIKKLADLDLKVLEEMIRDSVADTKQRYPD